MSDDPLSVLLWRARQNAGLTISEAADKADIGYMTVWRAENTRVDSLKIINALAGAYGLKIVVALVEEEQ